jgi:hypothetical protein
MCGRNWESLNSNYCGGILRRYRGLVVTDIFTKGKDAAPAAINVYSPDKLRYSVKSQIFSLI